MIVTNNAAVRFLTFGKTSIPIRLAVSQMVDDVRHLSKAQHKDIIRDQGVEVPGGMDAKQVLFMAMSMVQNCWFEANGKKPPQMIESRHIVRLAQFVETAERIKVCVSESQKRRISAQMEIPGTPEPVSDPSEVVQ